jgi:hypothetical protein
LLSRLGSSRPQGLTAVVLKAWQQFMLMYQHTLIYRDFNLPDNERLFFGAQAPLADS